MRRSVSRTSTNFALRASEDGPPQPHGRSVTELGEVMAKATKKKTAKRKQTTRARMDALRAENSALKVLFVTMARQFLAQ